ncbi:MAG: hypothetical protein WCG51_01705, partial [Elusimicrobiota bacterium]
YISMMKRGTVAQPFDHIIETLVAVAKKHGFVIYAVGGFVRDLYAGRESKDLDIMVEGKDGGVRFAEIVARELGIREPVIFQRFGTAKLSIEGQEIECVMPRTEYYKDDSRNPDTGLGTLEQDAKRRDFTMNALFWRLNDGEILDLTARGFADIAAGVIRVTDPENAGLIFSQDPLRMMRAIRQSVQLGFQIEPATYAAITANAHRLTIVAVERIADELNKMLVSDAPVTAMNMLVETTLFGYVFPQAAMENARRSIASRQDTLLAHVEKNLSLRLAAVISPTPGTDDAEMALAVMQRLKYSKDNMQAVGMNIRFAADLFRYESSWPDPAVRRLIYRCGDYVQNVLSFARARAQWAGDTASVVLLDNLDRRIIDVQRVLAVKDMGNILTGKELMTLFDRSGGVWIQKIKEALLQAQFDNPALSKEEAVAIARANAQ